MPIRLMFITNNPEIAMEAQLAGVDRIFVDLETIGKLERQGHLDTVKSFHTMEDVSIIRSVLDSSQLLVRVNPLHQDSFQEIKEVISRGADIVMLPMFKSVREVEVFLKHVGGRAKTCLLLETAQALARIDEITDVKGIDEIHIGLNDLHLSMGLDFMFELLSGGIVEYACQKINAKGIDYGFGGMARIGQGILPAEKILAEHYRLGSKMVILSRTFHGRAETIDTLNKKMSLSEEIEKIRLLESKLINWSEEQFNKNKNEVKEIVNSFVELKK